MNFSQKYPLIYHEYNALVARLHRPYLRVGRLAQYLGSGYVLAYSHFGQKYRLRTNDLEALKPLFKPSAADLSISALSMLLHRPGAHYAYIYPSSSYHLLNTAHMQKGEGKIFVFEQELDRLEEIASNAYLNDLQDFVQGYRSCEWTSLRPDPSPIEEVLENGLTRAPSPNALSSIDRITLDTLSCSPSMQERTFESILGDDALMELRAIIFDNTRELPLPSSHLATLSLLNNSCYFLIRIGAQHNSQWPIFQNQWSTLGYNFWRLPDLKNYEGPEGYACRWVLAAHENCFS